MTTIKIDTDIPMPKSRNRYPYAKLNVGHSFFVEGQTSQGSAADQSGRHAKKTGKKFSACTVTENGITGVRIWRVE